MWLFSLSSDWRVFSAYIERSCPAGLLAQCDHPANATLQHTSWCFYLRSKTRGMHRQSAQDWLIIQTSNKSNKSSNKNNPKQDLRVDAARTTSPRFPSPPQNNFVPTKFGASPRRSWRQGWRRQKTPPRPTCGLKSQNHSSQTSGRNLESLLGNMDGMCMNMVFC